MATDENTLTDEQRAEKEAEKARLEQESESLEREAVKVIRKMDVLSARHTTNMFREGIGQGLMVSAQKRLMDAEMTLRLADDESYQVLLDQRDDLYSCIAKLRKAINRLYRELHPDDPYGVNDFDDADPDDVGDFED